jgi:Ca2+/Na+ antiporter
MSSNTVTQNNIKNESKTPQQISTKKSKFFPHYKRRNPYLKASVIITSLIVIITLFSTIRIGFNLFNLDQTQFVEPNLQLFTKSSPSAQFSPKVQNVQSFSLSTYQLNDDPEPEPEPGPEFECDQVNTFDGDKCQFVKDNCDPEGFFSYMEFTYCIVGNNNIFEKGISLTFFSVILLLLLMLLSSSADIWLVQSLTVVGEELKLSPAVAGASLLSLANGAPDILTTLASMKAHAEDGQIGLVLGSLSGATVCICGLVLGLCLIAANGKSLLSKSSFLRNSSGLVFCLLPTIFLCWKGYLTIIDGIIFVVLYLVYLIGSIILLQKQDARKRKVAKQERRDTFLRSTTSYRLLFPESNNKSESVLNEGLLSSQDESTPRESNINFLSTSPLSGLSILSNQTENKTSNYILQDVTSPTGSTSLHIQQLNSDPESGLNLPSSPLDDIDNDNNNNNDDDDDDDDADQTYFMEGLFFDPSWKKLDESTGKREQNIILRNFSRILWVILWPFFLLRWLSIPSSDHRIDYLRGPKKFFTHIAPFFTVWVVYFAFLNGSFPLWVPLIAACVVVIALNLFYFLLVVPSVNKYNIKRNEVEFYVDSTKDQNNLTEDELHKISDLVLQYHLDGGDNNSNNERSKPFLMTLHMIFISSLAFIGAVGWLGLVAQEIVELLSTIGIMFNVSPTFLGLTVLAIGNSLPDAISNYSLASKGFMAMAYSAIWSAPVLSNTFGFGLSVIFATQKVSKIKYDISNQVLLCWISVMIIIVSTIIGYLVLFNRQPPAKFGYFMCSLYGAFIIAAIVVEIVS